MALHTPSHRSSRERGVRRLPCAAALGWALAAALVLGACTTEPAHQPGPAAADAHGQTLSVPAAPGPVTPAGAAEMAPNEPPSRLAPVIMVPPSNVGKWYALSNGLAPWLSGYGPTPVSGATAATRVAGLQAADGRWLAIVIVQQAPCGQVCADPGFDMREDAGRLNMRWDADFDHWLEQQHVELYQWIRSHGWVQSPRSWISYRIDQGGHAVQAHALVAPSLIEPATRNNTEFLAAGGSGALWAREFARATEQASGGTLKVPPFPYATVYARDDSEAAESDNATRTTQPAHAVQDSRPEPQQPRAPRADRQ